MNVFGIDATGVPEHDKYLRFVYIGGIVAIDVLLKSSEVSDGKVLGIEVRR